jgi:uncharacterized protein YecA (UPF0149 family)
MSHSVDKAVKRAREQMVRINARADRNDGVGTAATTYSSVKQREDEISSFRRNHSKDIDGVNRPDGKVATRIAAFGRNNPCPCGSGKKFKKCCIGRL